MRKRWSLFAAVAVLGGTIPATSPLRAARAQTTPAVNCTLQSSEAPMQGHYTGDFQAQADYHFVANFPATASAPAITQQIDIKMQLEGKLDANVTSDGHISGTLTGTVDLPIYDVLGRDISSGQGTVNGQLTGLLAGNNTLVTVAQPALDVHWGTFGGYAVERRVTLNDFHLTVASAGCVSLQGTGEENNFPDMGITSDGTGQMTEAPGVGVASAVWQLNSDKSGDFGTLSAQVDAFTSSAGALISGTAPLTHNAIQQQILKPLQDLEARIKSEPEVARCLLDKLGQWEASVIPALFNRVAAVNSSSDISALRAAQDTLQLAQALNNDCSLPDNNAAQSLRQALAGKLDAAIAAHDWSLMALVMRDQLLLGGSSVASSMQQKLVSDLHSQTSGGSSEGRLDIARIAFALGDSADASLAARSLVRARDSVPWQPASPSHGNKKKKPKHKKKPTKPTMKPTATPAPKPTVTPTATPPTLIQVLQGSLPHLQATATNDASPVFSWQPVPGAVRYVLLVTDPHTGVPRWSWSGTGASVTYGSTAIDGLATSDEGSWPIAAGSSYNWSLFALDAQGKIVALRLP